MKSSSVEFYDKNAYVGFWSNGSSSGEPWAEGSFTSDPWSLLSISRSFEKRRSSKKSKPLSSVRNFFATVSVFTH